MKTHVMDVLQYLYERFQDDEFVPLEENQSIIKELEKVGFKLNEIDSALNWLDGLVDASSDNFAPFSSNSNNIRVFHPHELSSFSTEARGFLYFLEQAGVLDSHSREAVIDRVLALNLSAHIDLDELKWVVSMVLFNLPDREEAAIWLENIDACFH
ncbi:MAG: DUF494 domain-containing protein [Kangiellaceae bacterium]